MCSPLQKEELELILHKKLSVETKDNSTREMNSEALCWDMPKCSYRVVLKELKIDKCVKQNRFSD